MLNNNSHGNFSYLHFISSFECGFNSIMTSLSNFSGAFLRLLVFFILLDVEVVLFLNSFLVSWHVGIWWCYLMFLLVVMCGFFYEIYWGLILFS
uniref:NADH-ubiquinone oxidoreductase chain 3 n=1 Tax=Microcotyle sebastis TaxID=116890 RepID=A3QRI3_MICSE|nr:NADH dehydrogenase subunit 3 [Microcotyle sebastis]